MQANLSGQLDLVTATEGATLASNTAVATFTDGTTNDTAANFTATINWGDGVTTTGTVVGSNGSFTVEGGHTYDDAGSLNAVITVTRDTDNAQLVVQGVVNVDDVNDLVSQGAPTSPAIRTKRSPMLWWRPSAVRSWGKLRTASRPTSTGATGRPARAR